MNSLKFKGQLLETRVKVLLCNTLDYGPNDIRYEDYQQCSSEDLAWEAYSLAEGSPWETERSLYRLYYLLLKRHPKLVQEVSMPAFFRGALKVPNLYPTLDNLLSDYELV